MSGTASVPNQFAAAVTATGAQLDANYSTLVAYINDPTNRNNYAADAGSTNTVVLSFVPPVVGGYTAGLELTWKWAAPNSGAVVANANGLGNISVVNPDGSALQSGQGSAGSIGKAISDGTRAIFISPPSPATKAQMQTATASASFVTPSLWNQHPAAPKAIALWRGTSTGTITPVFSSGVANVVNNGGGTYVINLSTAFSSTSWPAVGVGNPDTEIVLLPTIISKTATSCMFITYNILGNRTLANADLCFFGYGTQ